jgi:hypothetical protein
VTNQLQKNAENFIPNPKTDTNLDFTSPTPHKVLSQGQDITLLAPDIHESMHEYLDGSVAKGDEEQESLDSREEDMVC